MALKQGFSLARLWAVAVKEFLQLRRDRLTFGMIIGIPLIQLTLFGFAINSDPKHLPTAVVAYENTALTRSILAALQNSAYFELVAPNATPQQAEAGLREGSFQFVVTIPAGFSRALLRGERPALLVEADATDPVANANALSGLARLERTALSGDLTGPWAKLNGTASPFEARIHRRYNPDGVSQFNIVPGLMGVILTMTMVLMTALAVTRERERGTFENLLAMPVHPLEVNIGKIVPYIAIGLIQISIILLLARFVFSVPMLGSILLLYVVVLLFIAANLTLGILFSTLARNQLQAMQMTFFFFLPSILLSGYMFPFRGMPDWAQVIGNVLPLTHFLRIVRGILLKGNGWIEIAPEVWPMAVFAIVVILIGWLKYRKTLD